MIEKKQITKAAVITATLIAVTLTTSCCGNSGVVEPLTIQSSYLSQVEVSATHEPVVFSEVTEPVQKEKELPEQVEVSATHEPVVFSEVTESVQKEKELPEDEEILDIRYTMEDVEAMVLTLAGECYDDKPEDKRLVCEVILNRVSNGNFGDTPYEVCSAPYQFSGYAHQSRPVTENDYEIVYQALKDWHDNGYQALSEWLYFSAGDNHENVFRKEY